MILNLKTKSIYTDKGEFLKKVQCPLDVTEEDLVNSKSNPMIKNCSHCRSGVYKTENLSDEELKELVKENPAICFYVKLNQSNISKIEAGELLYFKNMSGSCSIECLDCDFESELIVFNMRFESNAPCQCQECGMIYKNLDESTCSHDGIINTEPIFCEECYSFNVKVGKFLIG
jgi:hypothetical protein